MKLSKLSLISLASLFAVGAQASTCVNYNLSTDIVQKISSSFLSNGKSISFGLSKYDDGSTDEAFYVDEQDTIIYSKDMSSTVGFSSINGDCDLTYVHYEHLPQFKSKNTSCDSVIKSALQTIGENHSLLKEASSAGTLQFEKTFSETGPVMTTPHGKKIGIYDFLDATYSATVGDKVVKVSFETFKTKRTINTKKTIKTNGITKTKTVSKTVSTCFLSSANVTQN